MDNFQIKNSTANSSSKNDNSGVNASDNATILGTGASSMYSMQTFSAGESGVPVQSAFGSMTGLPNMNTQASDTRATDIASANSFQNQLQHFNGFRQGYAAPLSAFSQGQAAGAPLDPSVAIVASSSSGNCSSSSMLLGNGLPTSGAVLPQPHLTHHHGGSGIGSTNPQQQGVVAAGALDPSGSGVMSQQQQRQGVPFPGGTSQLQSGVGGSFTLSQSQQSTTDASTATKGAHPLPGIFPHAMPPHNGGQSQQSLRMSMKGPNPPRPWHSNLPDGHSESRKSMSDRIIELLQQRKPNANTDWQDKLPLMARKLEEALFFQANSLEEYLDVSTLKYRLQELASHMTTAKARMQQSTGSGHTPMSNVQMAGMPAGAHYPYPMSQQQLGHPQQPQGHNMSMLPHGSMPYSSMAQQQASQSQYMAHGSQALGGAYMMPPAGMVSSARGVGPSPQLGFGMNAPGSYPHMSMGRFGGGGDPQSNDHAMEMNGQAMHHMHYQRAAPGMPGSEGPPPTSLSQRQFVDISQINPLVGGHVPSMPPSTHQRSDANMTSGQEYSFDSSSVSHSNRVAGPGSEQQQYGGMSAPTPSHSDEHRKQVLKQQQHRLLLLRHASKCPHDNGLCPVTSHCAGMKQLWKHIMSCKDQECKVPHCVSSRYVLSHYSKCKEVNCPVCSPVREAIRRNYEKGRELTNAIGKPGDHGEAYPGEMLMGGAVGERPRTNEPPHKRIKLASEGASAAMTQAGMSSSSLVSGSGHPAGNQQQALLRLKAVPPKQLDPVSCALYCLTDEQVKAHIHGIQEGMRMTAAKVRQIGLPILDEVLKMPHAHAIFGSPVDPVFLGLPDYFDIIKFPMDLGTVRKRLEALFYRDLSFFVADVHLAFDNAMLYNPKSTDVHMKARDLKKEFDKKYKLALSSFERTLELNRQNVENCPLCGEKKLIYEPPVYYCDGRCGGQRIRRNNFFYSSGNNHWCQQCFSELKENQPIHLSDNTIITKSELAKSKKKHSLEEDETWVACDGSICGGRWVHAICGLFNPRRNFGDDVKYFCPDCMKEKRRNNPSEGVVAALTSKTRASDLPQTTMSQFIERRIAERLEAAYQEISESTGVPLADVEKVPPLVLRQVSSIDKSQPTREGMRERYKHKNYPTEFPCRTKCMVLFQNIDGIDVILFGMYVYEYGHKCSAPNQRRVYVSYLDSVHYFRPKRYRTIVYHEILVSYLEYVKRRGFHTAHIWSCPPAKGDDYILYCHPQDQKTPKTDKLQQWYADMIEISKKRGITIESVDLHTEYLVDPSLDATVLPYFEGDYWTTEAEVIIKALEEESSTGSTAQPAMIEDAPADSEGAGDGSTSKSKRKSKGNSAPAAASAAGASSSSGRGAAARGGTRSSAKITIKSIDNDRDPVMAKLAAIIEPMKNTFFVVKLYGKDYIERCATLTQDTENSETSIQVALQGEEKVDPTSKSKRIESVTTTSSFSAKGSVSSSSDATQKSVKMEGTSNVATTELSSVPERAEQSSDVDPKAADDGALKGDGESSAGSDGQKMDVCVECKTENSYLNIDTPAWIAALNIKDDTEDLDEPQESEHWDQRQSFLNLCQGNHYQFDQLRRAKHTSMMVLYHMHNPDAPKFVYSCSTCTKDILQGNRYRCETCDYDLCQQCATELYKTHPHRLKAIPLSGPPQQPQLTEQERRERQRNLQLHLQLLQHAAYCEDGAQCTAKNCSRMKDFFLHFKNCKLTSKGCAICKRVNTIMTMHARSCRTEKCRVLNCVQLREAFRRMAVKQQQMDDRRRARANEEFHHSGGGAVPTTKAAFNEKEQAS